MTNTLKEIHNGIEITFSRDQEDWWANVGDEQIRDKSLAAVKEYIDKMKKKEFKRVPVFTVGERYRSGKEEVFKPRYVEAVISSVSPNGNAYVMKNGSKHAEKEGLRYTYLIDGTEQNRKLLAEYEKYAEEEFNADKKKEAVMKKIKRLDGNALFKSIYDRDL